MTAKPLDQSTVEMAEQICGQQLTLAAAATMHELQRRFELAIEQLDAQNREVVLMRHCEELSDQEVADSLRIL